MVRGYPNNQNGGEFYTGANLNAQSKPFQNQRWQKKFQGGNRRNFDFDRSRGYNSNGGYRQNFRNNRNYTSQRIISKPYNQNGFKRNMAPFRNNQRGGRNFRFNAWQNKRVFVKGRFNKKPRNNTAAGGELEEAINSSRRIQNINKRGNFKVGRGGKRFYNNRKKVNETKESLDAQLDNYMGDDAVKSRLDLALYNYFSGNNTEVKNDEVFYE